MKILLICGVGASSGFMAQSMRRAAKAHSIEATIIARSESELSENMEGVDVLLIGPHLAYKGDAIKREVEKFNIPVEFINSEIYGSIDGEALLMQVVDILKNK